MSFAAREPATFLSALRIDRAARSVLRWALTGGAPSPARSPAAC
ncbi:hypothetical protein ACFSTI_04670 [Rhizorhabdus histidinilytica]